MDEKDQAEIYDLYESVDGLLIQRIRIVCVPHWHESRRHVEKLVLFS